MNPEIIDNINKPSHYQGANGLEAIDVVHNFVGNLFGASAFFWGNAIKYMLRFQKKNGLEDLKKARKNLDWLIEEMEHEWIRVISRRRVHNIGNSCGNQ
ncbi:gp29 [Streptococcus pneumoniae]|nr:gp29 [Streptococcus pneumoniae]